DGELRDLSRGRDAADVRRAVLGEPQVAVRADGDALGGARRCRQLELGERAGRGQPADLRLPLFGEPEVAVRSGHHPVGLRRRRGAERDGELGQVAVRVEPGDLVGPLLGEPQVPVGPDGDPVGPALGVGQGVLLERPAGRHPADLVPGELREPQVAVRPAHDVVGPGLRGRDGPLLDRPRARHGGDPARGELGEPHVPVRPGGDPHRLAVLRLQAELLHGGAVRAAGAPAGRRRQRHHRHDAGQHQPPSTPPSRSPADPHPRFSFPQSSGRAGFVPIVTRRRAPDASGALPPLIASSDQYSQFTTSSPPRIRQSSKPSPPSIFTWPPPLWMRTSSPVPPTRYDGALVLVTSRVSFPPSPTSVASWTLSAVMLSSPSSPRTMDLPPGPAVIESLPAAPQMKSLPPRPSMVSSPSLPMMVSSPLVPSSTAGPGWPEASSQVWLAGSPLQSPPMAWAAPGLSSARPSRKPPVAVAVMSRAAAVVIRMVACLLNRTINAGVEAPAYGPSCLFGIPRPRTTECANRRIGSSRGA